MQILLLHAISTIWIKFMGTLFLIIIVYLFFLLIASN